MNPLEYSVQSTQVNCKITAMELKLEQAKNKNPDKDYKEAEDTITIFSALRDNFNIINSRNYIQDMQLREEFSTISSLKIFIAKLVEENKSLENQLKEKEYYKQ